MKTAGTFHTMTTMLSQNIKQIVSCRCSNISTTKRQNPPGTPAIRWLHLLHEQFFPGSARLIRPGHTTISWIQSFLTATTHLRVSKARTHNFRLYSLSRHKISPRHSCPVNLRRLTTSLHEVGRVHRSRQACERKSQVARRPGLM
jgi:hypothetical protein